MLLLLKLILNKSIKRTSLIFRLLISTLFFTPIISQAQYWKLNKIDNDQGLSNSAVTSIFLDSKQYMWFGTWDGLNKYDGRQVSVYKPDALSATSIGNNIIRKIFEDKHGNQ